MEHAAVSDSRGRRSWRLAVCAAFVVAFQLPLLAPFRRILVDEWVIADSAYALLTGTSWVPPLPGWSLIVPEFSTINFHYTPGYFYLLAGGFGLLGFSPLTTGLLHFALRLLHAGAFFAVGRRLGLPARWCALLTVVWAAFVQGDPGRPEDLAFLWVLLSLYCLSGRQRSLRSSILAGVFLGLGFLVHPLALPVGAILDLALVVATRPLRPAFLSLACTAAVSAAVSSMWLIWIIPYRHEFEVIFLDFVIREARSGSYLSSLKDFWIFFISGQWMLPCSTCFRLPMEYSLVPLGTLVLLLLPLGLVALFGLQAWLGASPLLVWVGQMLKGGGYGPASMALAAAVGVFFLSSFRLLRTRGSLQKAFILLPVLALPLLLARNNIYWVPFRWFNLTLMFVAIAAAAFAYGSRQGLLRGEKSALALVAGAVLLQSVVALVSAWLPMLAGLEAAHVCGRDPYTDLLSRVPAGDKVLTTDGHAFYRLRQEHPVFWPAGSRGAAWWSPDPAKVIHYDDSHRWVVLRRPAKEGGSNPGGKFAWDAATYAWFDTRYEQVAEAAIASCAGHPLKLARYLEAPGILHLYGLKSGRR